MSLPRLLCLPVLAAAFVSTPAHADEPSCAFILGADTSWVQEQEDQGIRFFDQVQEKDILAILKDHGFNWIRLRVFKPAAWTDLHGADLEKAVHDHAQNVMAALKKQGTAPDMVQIGNEISNGFLWPDGKVWETKKWEVFCGLIYPRMAEDYRSP